MARPWRRTSVAVVLAIVGAGHVQAASKTGFTSTNDAACEVAKAVMPALLAGAKDWQRVTLSLSPPTFSLARHSEATVGSGWDGDAPSPDLVHRFYAAQRWARPVCKDALDQIRTKGASTLDASETAKVLRPPPAANSPFVHKIGEPVISSDGSNALVFATVERASLGGGERLLHLARTGSGWKVVGVKILAIS